MVKEFNQGSQFDGSQVVRYVMETFELRSVQLSFSLSTLLELIL